MCSRLPSWRARVDLPEPDVPTTTIRFMLPRREGRESSADSFFIENVFLYSAGTINGAPPIFTNAINWSLQCVGGGQAVFFEQEPLFIDATNHILDLWLLEGDVTQTIASAQPGY